MKTTFQKAAALLTSLTVLISAAPAGIFTTATEHHHNGCCDSVSAAPSENGWQFISAYGSSVGTMDYTVTYGGDYSLRIDNLDIADGFFLKTFAMDYNTDYRVSAMAKFESGGTFENAGAIPTGANISVCAYPITAPKNLRIYAYFRI